MSIETKNRNIAKLYNSVHRACFVCGELNNRGLQCAFYYDKDEEVAFSQFRLDDWTQGYEGIPHGGIVSAIFDCAMGNCLFAKNLTAVTAELNVRFKEALEMNRKAIVRAWVKNSSNGLYILDAEIVQNEQVKAFATGKFVDKPGLRNSLDK